MKRLILGVTLLLSEVCGATVTSIYEPIVLDRSVSTIETVYLYATSWGEIPIIENFVVTDPDMNVGCPSCKNSMKNLGNVAESIYCSDPPQWDEVWVCDSCKVKKTIRKTGVREPNYDYLKNYKEVR